MSLVQIIVDIAESLNYNNNVDCVPLVTIILNRLSCK